MASRVKLDEDLSPVVAEPLREAGYDVASVREQGWSGLKDAELWPRVVAEGRLFITADKGFADVRAYPPGTHAGILLLRPDGDSILEYRGLLASTVGSHSLKVLAGTIAVATPRGLRIRRQSDSG